MENGTDHDYVVAPSQVRRDLSSAGHRGLFRIFAILEAVDPA
jgi:hypothetical protein